MSHPRGDDRWQITMVKRAVELEDIRTRHVLPYDNLLTKPLFLIHLACTHVLSSLTISRTHLLELRRVLET